jgi:hypothetical protein
MVNFFVLTERFVEFPVEVKKLVCWDLALAWEFAARSMLGLFKADASEALTSAEISNVDQDLGVPPTKRSTDVLSLSSDPSSCSM